MSRLRFIHAADLHLDSPFSGMRREAPGQIADTLHKATFDAYDNIINLCLEEQVDALLVAGDIYDGADRSLRARLRFVEGLKRLEDAGIRSFVCHGNHDPLDGWETWLDRLPPGCVSFGPNVEGKPVFPDEPKRAMIYGISYPKRDVSENLSLRFTETKSEFSVGLLHANVVRNTEPGPYAQCTVDDLVETDIDYWALGHVHTRRILREKNPVVAYPGNTQGRHSNEPDSRGVYLVDVDEGGTPHLDFREIDVVRWKTFSLDIGGINDEQDLLSAIDDKASSALELSGGRPIIIRIDLTGRGHMHRILNQEGTDDILAQINKSYGGNKTWVWCDDISLNTASPIDREEVARQDDFTGYLARLVVDLRADQAKLDKLKRSLNDLYLKPHTREYLGEHIPSGDRLQELLADAEDECLAALVGEADDT